MKELIAQGPVDVLVGRLRAHAEAHEYIANADPEQRRWMEDLYDAADALERAPRWRDVADELPQEAQEVLFVRGGKTVHGAWIGGIFWHSNQKMAAAQWMPLPAPPKVGAGSTATEGHNGKIEGSPLVGDPSRMEGSTT
jgi:hypothetical protein